MQTAIYLDNNATTRPLPEVIDAMTRSLAEAWANPSSAHSGVSAAREVVGSARRAVADLIGAESMDEIVFTSGGTESDNLAILGALRPDEGRDEIVTTRVEHEAVRKRCERLEASGRRVHWIDIDEHGRPDLEQLRNAINPRTAVVSAMLANNETGVIFPIGEMVAIVKERSRDALLHVDAVGAAGKIAIDAAGLGADLVSISAHKFHGPKGIGALYVRKGVRLAPMFAGGGQEMGLRAGTEAVHQIAGIGAAAQAVNDLEQMRRVEQLRDRLENFILENIPQTSVNGAGVQRLPNTSNISFENTNGEMLLHFFDQLGIYVSTGSACNSASRETSTVLAAMDVPYSRAMGSIRLSLGRETTEAEIERVIEVLPGIVNHARGFSERLKR